MALSPKVKKTLAGWGVALATAIVGGLEAREGMKLTTYWDSLGRVWTVCEGVTGLDAIPGKTYTKAECKAIEMRFVNLQIARMGKCVKVPVTFDQAKAWGDFAWNVGTANFCGSTAVMLINAGKDDEACAQISRWKFAGNHDCSLMDNVCDGVWIRRVWERAVCEGMA